MLIESFSAEDTYNLASNIAKKSNAGDIYCLTGDLGAGKTIFVKGFAKGMGVTQDVTSPTFSLINEYEAYVPLYHFDVYRISSLSELDSYLFSEYFYGEGICIVEWALNIKSIIPLHAIWIEIKKDYSLFDDYRLINIIEV